MYPTRPISTPLEFSTTTVGNSSIPYFVASSSFCRIISGARSCVCISSLKLDREVFDQAEFADDAKYNFLLCKLHFYSVRHAVNSRKGNSTRYPARDRSRRQTLRQTGSRDGRLRPFCWLLRRFFYGAADTSGCIPYRIIRRDRWAGVTVLFSVKQCRHCPILCSSQNRRQRDVPEVRDQSAAAPASTEFLNCNVPRRSPCSSESSVHSFEITMDRIIGKIEHPRA